uniref:Uncharacterized protein n=1 Tax=Octopus bimaculoides TaxID=37653 RepID=A0A0L8HIS9_OCTBM
MVSSTLIFSIPSTFVYSKQHRIVGQSRHIGEVCSSSDSLNDTVYPLIYYTTLLVGSCFMYFVLIIIYSSIGKRVLHIYRAKVRRHSSGFFNSKKLHYLMRRIVMVVLQRNECSLLIFTECTQCNHIGLI